MSKCTQTTQAGQRFQNYANGDIHVHADGQGTKFVSSGKEFKGDVEEFFDTYKDSNEGVAILEGTSKEKLYLINDNGKIQVFVEKKDSDEKELKDFLNKL